MEASYRLKHTVSKVVEYKIDTQINSLFINDDKLKKEGIRKHIAFTTVKIK